MAVNLVLMRLGRKRPAQVPLEGVVEFSEGNAQCFREIGRDDLSLDASIDRVCLERAVAQLPACYRLVFELHDVQGYKHTEIAERTDCSAGNSATQRIPADQNAAIVPARNIRPGPAWFA